MTNIIKKFMEAIIINMTNKTSHMLLAFALALCFVLCSVSTAFADMGPKASTIINISGIEGDYAATLLSLRAYAGPWSTEMTYESSNEWQACSEEDWMRFKEYNDDDGYYFIGFVKSFSGDAELRWTYMRPDNFKLLIYSEETDEYYISKPMECYAFASVYNAKIIDGELQLTEVHSFAGRLAALIFRIAMTIAIELLTAVTFGFKTKKHILIILVVNILTQVLLNILLIGYEPVFFFYVIRYAGAELIVLIAESAIYTSGFKKIDEYTATKKKIIPYAIVANIASFVLGYLISFLMPEFFI